jgi:hypothetical protein
MALLSISPEERRAEVMASTGSRGQSLSWLTLAAAAELAAAQLQALTAAQAVRALAVAVVAVVAQAIALADLSVVLAVQAASVV